MRPIRLAILLAVRRRDSCGRRRSGCRTEGVRQVLLQVPWHRGKGDGPQADALTIKPRDFTDCARMKAMSDDTLFTAIKEGGEAVHLSKDMPAWKDGMDDDEIHDLIAYVRSLCTK